MTFNFASAWETIADTYGDSDALISGDLVRSWTDYEQRAALLAGAFRSAGVGYGANVGLCLYNGPAYSEAQFALFKERSIPFNINYRYGPAELASLLDNADAQAVFFHAELADRFHEIRDRLAKLKLVVQVGGAETPEWAVDFEDLVAGAVPASRIERSPDDLWMLYTGGTTGHPKGVMWPHGQMIKAMGPTFAGMKLPVPESVANLMGSIEVIRDRGFTTRQLAAAPLMHGTSGIAAMTTHTTAGSVLTMPQRSLDGHALWNMVQEHGATQVTIVGDAFARPMLVALEEAAERGEPYDLSTLFLILSSGVMWSAPIKEGLLEHGNMKLVDSLGSSEATGFGSKISGKGEKVTTASFELGPNTQVFTEEGQRVEPGSGVKGILAVGGPLPIGYYGDPEKSAETWKEIDGQRWSVPGDWALVEADGSITLLGRGSVSINSGGEKIYPEEVEEAVKLHADVVDANVVGVPDERWGEAVTAVVQLVPGANPDDADIIATARGAIASYKAPKTIVRVDAIQRGPNGKPNYQWAKQTVLDAFE